jgi:hypothetical protein
VSILFFYICDESHPYHNDGYPVKDYTHLFDIHSTQEEYPQNDLYLSKEAAVVYMWNGLALRWKISGVIVYADTEKDSDVLDTWARNTATLCVVTFGLATWVYFLRSA